MLKFILVAVVFICVSSIESKSVDPFIIRGNDAAVGQFPYFASIRYSDEHLHGCGGAILNKRFILSAAHCFGLDERAVDVGSVHVNNGTRYPIRRSIQHPLFPPTLELIGHNYSNWHDVGLLELNQPIVFNNLVRPVPLARRRVNGNSRAVVAGLGAIEIDQTWTSGTAPTHLQYLRTQIITNTECSARTRVYGIFETRMTTPIVYSGHICTLNPSGVGTCFGDSGSPLVTSDGVVGIVATGAMPCGGRAGAPDIYVRVSTYLQWIDLILQA